MSGVGANPPAVSEKSAVSASPSTLPGRLMSVDALRGFDMFWIIGADALVYALKRLSTDPVTKKSNPITAFLAEQLDHVEWAGFHFYDMIFPLFVFIMGVSL